MLGPRFGNFTFAPVTRLYCKDLKFSIDGRIVQN